MYANKLKSGKSRQSGFTLLELLVVVAILAAIAGTASIALKDTDARASAAAHVAMMDELNKGIQTFRVLQRNQLPNRLDSLMQVADAAAETGVGAVALANLGFAPADGYAIGTLPAGVQQIMEDAGMTELRYVRANAGTSATYNCADITALVGNRANDVVAGNIFMGPTANGCGFGVTIDGASTTEPSVMYWAGGQERLTGQPGPATEFIGTNLAAATGNAYMLTGLGPSATLFDANTLGGMTTVPVYRHVRPNEYNRFIAVWNVGTFDAGAVVAAAQIDLTAIIDGALDTKEEELGEWDGTRNTI